MVSALTYTYDGSVGTTTAGDLIQRTDIGKFGTNGLHRITRASGANFPFPYNDPPLAILPSTQNITYTSYHQPSTISETVYGILYQLEYLYDADQQRNYSKLRNMTTQSTVEERWYEHGLETQRLNGQASTDRKILYVEGGDGLCAMIVAEPGGAQTAYAVYRPDPVTGLVARVEIAKAARLSLRRNSLSYCDERKASKAFAATAISGRSREAVAGSGRGDHLGSIVAVTRHTFSPELLEGGNSGPPEIIAEQNFDAWGRKRNPTTWAYTGVPEVPTWLYRGYTGHEHMEHFSLINMNGRLYDPLNGRMLSADNYVQGALGTQGYNRYSYAGNNPLKYTDPSGEFLWVPFAIGATIFGYLGGSSANGGEWDPGKWDFNSGKTWAGMGIGAVVGGFAAVGAVHAGMALSGTSLFAAFSNGSVAAFGLTLGAGGAAAGYATGFGTGLMNSNGDAHIANKIGGYYAGIGAAIGTGIGLLYGGTEQGRSYMGHGQELLLASLEAGGARLTHPNGINYGQAWWHFRNGHGAPLSTNLSTIDLSGIHRSDFDLTQPYTEFSLLGKYRSNLSDGLVFGTLALSLSADITSAYSTIGIDMYDFNLRPWSNYFWRNIATVFGNVINTHGTVGSPFPIVLYGSAPIAP